ncbi:MAG: hypothetical protein UHN02_01580 [Acutalibacteraceae bacterium]|nr:hypothetical protein [Acutalibacteraceae bacterium]
MNIVSLICMALCLAATVAGSILFYKKSSIEGKANYMVRSVSGNMASVVVFLLVQAFCLTVMNLLKTLTGLDSNTYIDTALIIMATSHFLNMLFCLFSVIYSKLNRFILLAISGAYSLVLSAITLIVCKNSEVFSYIIISVAVMFAFMIFSSVNTLLDINNKAQKIALCVIDIIILILFTFIIIKVVNVGVSVYQTGIVGSVNSALIYLVPLAIVVGLPPVLVLFSILSSILSSFQKNM